MKNTRIREIDVLKGIGIILMVLGHSGSYLRDFIYVFHMPLFFLAAGFCYSGKGAENRQEIKKYIIRKLKSLYVPYVAVGLILLIMTNIFLKLDIITNNPQFVNSALNEFNGIVNYLDFTGFAKNVICLLLFGVFGGEISFFGAAWFLPVIFLAEITYLALDVLSIHLFKKNKYQMIFTFTICFALMIFSYLIQINGIEVELFGIRIIDKIKRPFMACILIDIGRKIKAPLLNNIKKTYTCGILAGVELVVIYIFSTFNTLEMSKNQIINPQFYILSSVIGFTMCFYLSRILVNIKKDRILVYIGQHTLPILFLHFLAFKPITALQVSLAGLPSYMRASFPVLFTEPYWVFAYCFLGIALPLGADWIYKKIWIVAKVYILRHRCQAP